ncbi:unnamed protein product [Cuscuta europaea]|uniref:Protein kinase domain-containing protein n=1 Tax=Cuscuta europaea TaxID=41803 RepID=A0A9P0YQN8_CUSEU|nr:unnamed protein product [Cuscuta europaea]
MSSEPSGVISENINSGARGDIHNRDERVSSISLETGEVFSAEFTPRKVPTMNDSQNNRGGFTIPQNDVVYEDLNGLLGIQRRGFESIAGNHGAHMDGNRATRGPAENSPHSCHPYSDDQEGPYKPFSKKLKFLCSFGGRISRGPNNGRLRYVGGETRIISIRKNLTYDELVKKTRAIYDHPHTIKYQLTGEDLDALISVTSDEDLHNMIEEFQDSGKISQFLRLFLVHSSEEETLCSFEPLTLQPSQFGSTLDYSQSYQRDSPASFHPFNIIVPKNPTTHQFNTYQSPPLSPLAGHQLKDFKRFPDLAFTNIQCDEGNDSCSPYPVDQCYCCSNPLSCYRKKDCNLVELHKACESIPQNLVLQHCIASKLLLRPDLHTKSGCGMHHAISDPQLHCEQRYNVPSNFNIEKCPSLEMISSSKELSMQGKEVRDDKQFEQQNLKESDFVKQLKQKNLYSAQQESYLGTKETCTRKAYGGRNSSKPLVSPSNNTAATICIEHCNDPNACWGTTLKPAVSENRNFSTGLMKPSTNNCRDECFGLSDRSGCNIEVTDPLVSDISLQNSAAAFAQDFTVNQGMSNGKQTQQKSEGLSNQKHETLFEFQLSDNSNRFRVPDGPSSANSFPHEQDEPDYKNKKAEGDREGLSINDAANIETEAGICGFQIIRNSDLEELRELGSGTFGTVHHGKWRGTDVAIKMIKKSCFAGRLSEQERLTNDFWREAKILSDLRHPNVVAFYGVVPDGPEGTMATVTEYMANGSLRHVLRRKDRTLDRRKKLMIALDAAFGMEYLHLKNIVHFDLKCENLLVNLGDPQRPVCKVGDFGLSRIKRNTLVSGGVRGTLPWMAPELLNGSSSRVSEKVDVFSFGITMWEILTGEEPFASMHCGTIIGGIVNNTLRPPIPQRCDSAWRKLMEDCWEFDPAERPSFTEITNRLRAMSAAFQPKMRVKR